MIFDDFVLNDAHSGFFNRHLGKRDSRLIGCGGCSQKDGVNLFLRVGSIDLLCRSDFSKRSFKLLHAVNDLVVLVLRFHGNPPVKFGLRAC